MQASTDRRGEVLALAAAVLWGTSWPAIAFALEGLSPLGIAFVRGIAQGTLLLVLLVALTGGREYGFNAMRWRPTAHQIGALVGLGLLGGFFNVGQSYAVELSGTASASFVAGLYPVVAVVAAPFVLSEPMTRRTVTAIVAAAVGVLLVANIGAAETSHVAGLALAALSATAFGLYLVAARRLMSTAGLPPLVTTVAAFFATAVIAGALASVVGEPLVRQPAPGVAVAIAWLVVVAGVLPLALTELAIRAIPTARSSPYLLVTPIVAASIGILVLGERLAPPQLAGAMLIVAGIAVATVAPTPAVTVDGAAA